jgi:phosphoribosylformimino-5-aminoimidazole carboxamide ribotide isomerase
MRIRPCIDIHNGKVKQIVGSSLRDRSLDSAGTATENFATDKEARYYAALYKEMELPGGHIILLNSVKEENAYRMDLEQAFGALRAYPGGMQAGGGITPETAGDFLDAGASHVIVTSYVFKDGRLNEAALGEMIRCVGRNRLVLDLSCRKKEGSYMIVTDRWQKFTDCQVDEKTLDMLMPYCSEYLIHAVDVEGKASGIEKELARLLGAGEITPAALENAREMKQNAEKEKEAAS